MNKLYTKADQGKIFSCDPRRKEEAPKKMHVARCRGKFGESSQKITWISYFKSQKSDEISQKRRKNKEKCTDFVQVVCFWPKKDDIFYEMNDKKILQTAPKYDIIHKSDMR